MPQIQAFQCPACGASLKYDGGAETSLACPFCGTTVIVPAEMRSQPASSPAPAAAGTPFQGNLEARVKKELADSAVGLDEDPELGELVGLELSQMIEDASQTADAQAAQMAQEAVRLARSGQMQAAVIRFRQAFPSVSEPDAGRALKLMSGVPFENGSVPPQKKAPAPANSQPWKLGNLFGRKRGS